ncbi:hypothetical protein [Salinirarus marinus]|uniref:hypothetical protein n=1 Tax=Salinirarus marinus TaxID=3068310 RepID=UPI003C6CC1B3
MRGDEVADRAAGGEVTAASVRVCYDRSSSNSRFVSGLLRVRVPWQTARHALATSTGLR